MSIQDAIEVLLSIEDTKSSPIFAADYKRIKQSCEIAVDRLKRDIPRRIQWRQKYNSWACPICNCEVEKSDCYCSNCGQKLT